VCRATHTLTRQTASSQSTSHTKVGGPGGGKAAASAPSAAAPPASLPVAAVWLATAPTTPMSGTCVLVNAPKCRGTRAARRQLPARCCRTGSQSSAAGSCCTTADCGGAGDVCGGVVCPACTAGRTLERAREKRARGSARRTFQVEHRLQQRLACQSRLEVRELQVTRLKLLHRLGFERRPQQAVLARTACATRGCQVAGGKQPAKQRACVRASRRLRRRLGRKKWLPPPPPLAARRPLCRQQPRQGRRTARREAAPPPATWPPTRPGSCRRAPRTPTAAAS